MQHLKEQFIDQIQKTTCSLLKVLNSEKKILPVCFVPFRYISFCVRWNYSNLTIICLMKRE